jgi:hypothetical protein
MAREGIIAPKHAYVVEEDILALGTMVFAVHEEHIGAGSVGAEIFEAIIAVVTVGGDGIV